MTFRAFLALCALIHNAGCADFSRGETPERPDVGAAPDSGMQGNDGSLNGDGYAPRALAFGEVHPLLIVGCRECHRAGGQAGNTTFLLAGNASADLAPTLAYVNRESPANSRLLTKATGRNHGGGTVWVANSPQADVVLTWIQQGAQP